MENKLTLSWTDWRGKQHTREFNQTLDIRDFLGTTGYAILILAANAHLPASDIEFFLEQMSRQSEETQSAGRPFTWIAKRRPMFQKPGTPGTDEAKTACDFDGKQKRAMSLMSEHPKWSVRGLHRMLKQNGIERSEKWVRERRGDLRFRTRNGAISNSVEKHVESMT